MRKSTAKAHQFIYIIQNWKGDHDSLIGYITNVLDAQWNEAVEACVNISIEGNPPRSIPVNEMQTRLDLTMELRSLLRKC